MAIVRAVGLLIASFVIVAGMMLIAAMVGL